MAWNASNHLAGGGAEPDGAPPSLAIAKIQPIPFHVASVQIEYLAPATSCQQ